eukprot:5371274-Pyramimonas_sp.AAC.1
MQKRATATSPHFPPTPRELRVAHAELPLLVDTWQGLSALSSGVAEFASARASATSAHLGRAAQADPGCCAFVKQKWIGLQ